MDNGLSPDSNKHIEIAKEQIEAALGKTMRMDGVHAASYAETALDNGDVVEAREWLEKNIDGATGDARYHFQNAIDELRAISPTGNAEQNNP